MTASVGGQASRPPDDGVPTPVYPRNPTSRHGRNVHGVNHFTLDDRTSLATSTMSPCWLRTVLTVTGLVVTCPCRAAHLYNPAQRGEFPVPLRPADPGHVARRPPPPVLEVQQIIGGRRVPVLSALPQEAEEHPSSRWYTSASSPSPNARTTTGRKPRQPRIHPVVRVHHERITRLQPVRLLALDKITPFVEEPVANPPEPPAHQTPSAPSTTCPILTSRATTSPAVTREVDREERTPCFCRRPSAAEFAGVPAERWTGGALEAGRSSWTAPLDAVRLRGRATTPRP